MYYFMYIKTNDLKDLKIRTHLDHPPTLMRCPNKQSYTVLVVMNIEGYTKM